MAKIATFAHTDASSTQTVTRRADVYFYRDWSEYVVKFYRNGVHQAEADYFSGGDDDDCKADAIGTAKSFVFPLSVRLAARLADMAGMVPA